MEIGFKARWKHPPPASDEANHQEIQGACAKPKADGKKKRSGGPVFLEAFPYKDHPDGPPVNIRVGVREVGQDAL